MRKIVSSLLFVLFIGLSAFAQNEVLFNKATEAYNKGNYSTALEHYETILDNGKHSAELYFNMGNCYYKLDEIGLSIYYYEKAKLLNPKDQEIQNNLAYAENMRLDAIEAMPKTAMARFRDSTLSLFTYDNWALFAVLLSISFVILYILYYRSTYATQKRIFFIGAMVAIFLSVATVTLAYFSYDAFKKDNPAIVLKREIVVNTEPNTQSERVFSLHEGTKVNILEKLNGWFKVKIADGQTGWVQSNTIKLLKDF
ncbi:SH3 domain-containing protein [Croceivirga sp. JEA036]|uniref:SH3 domain-containing protein n=1 Tax=Croceivirga sp. JEA036 TaxID=2721162 RepID=UPI00143ADF5C|nr:SH3 domain-containing protein [Croceivirga sp. JEA036]NJB36943.1 SH3 domain-containing protein [Croceivirga sp. JEA036]